MLVLVLRKSDEYYKVLASPLPKSCEYWKVFVLLARICAYSKGVSAWPAGSPNRDRRKVALGGFRVVDIRRFCLVFDYWGPGTPKIRTP